MNNNTPQPIAEIEPPIESEGFFVDKNPINPTQRQNEDQAKEGKKEEQERTTIKKRMFLENFDKLICDVLMTSKVVGINPSTYYEWRKTDPEFKRKADAILYREGDIVEARLKKAIAEGNLGAIKFWLDRRHPKYKRNIKIEHQIIGDKTLEDLLDEDEKKLNQKNEKNKQGTNSGVIQDKGQAGQSGEIPIQSSAGTMVAEKNAQKSDN